MNSDEACHRQTQAAWACLRENSRSAAHALKCCSRCKGCTPLIKGVSCTQVVLAALAVVAAAAPQYDSREVVPILKDERQQDEYGRYNLDVQTGNGIVLAQSGSPDGPEGSVIKAGQYS